MNDGVWTKEEIDKKRETTYRDAGNTDKWIRTCDDKDERIASLEGALEIAHADMLKWGCGDHGSTSRALNFDLGKISYALNNGGKS